MACARASPSAEAMPASWFFGDELPHALERHRVQRQGAIRPKYSHHEVKAAAMPIWFRQIAGAQAPIGMQDHRIGANRAKGEAGFVDRAGRIHRVHPTPQCYAPGFQVTSRKSIRIRRSQPGALGLKRGLQGFEVDSRWVEFIAKPGHDFVQGIDIVSRYTDAQAKVRRGFSADLCCARNHRKTPRTGSEGTTAIVCFFKTIEGKDDGLKMIRYEPRLCFAAGAIGSHLQVRLQSLLKRNVPRPVHSHLEDFEGDEGFTAEEVHI